MTEDVVRAKRFELVDDEDQIRALIDTAAGEHVDLSFFGSEGQERLTLGVTSGGTATIILQDRDGKESVKATTQSDESDSAIVIKDSMEQTRIQAGLDQNEEPRMSVTDHEGNLSVQVSVGEDGSPSLLLQDSSGANAMIAVKHDTKGLVVAAENDTPRIGLLTLEDGSASISVADEEGQPRAMLRSDSDGTPFLVFLDEEGEPITESR